MRCALPWDARFTFDAAQWVLAAAELSDFLLENYHSRLLVAHASHGADENAQIRAGRRATSKQREAESLRRNAELCWRKILARQSRKSPPERGALVVSLQQFSLEKPRLWPYRECLRSAKVTRVNNEEMDLVRRETPYHSILFSKTLYDFATMRSHYVVLVRCSLYWLGRIPWNTW